MADAAGALGPESQARHPPNFHWANAAHFSPQTCGLSRRPAASYLRCRATGDAHESERLPPRPRRPRQSPRRQADRPRPRRRRRRRVVPRIQAVRDAGVRQRPAQAGDLRHQPGLRAPRGEGRGGRLCPRLRRVGGRDLARRRRGARGQGRPFRQICRGARAAPTASSTATTIRSRRRASTPR